MKLLLIDDNEDDDAPVAAWGAENIHVFSEDIQVILNYLEDYPNKRACYAIWDLETRESKFGFLYEFCDHTSTHRVNRFDHKDIPSFLMNGQGISPGLYCNICERRIAD